VDVVNQELLQKIVDRIRHAIQVEQIILFGSYAWGTPHQDSDVDLFIIVEASNEPGYRRARSVYAALRGVAVPIDIIVKTRAEVKKNATVITSLTKKVLEQGKVLYG
jgi:predicted nucleotidyltransferase